MQQKNKVLIYVVKDEKVLVFTHPDFPDAGIQVPAGTVKEGETTEEAAQRELVEETGKDCFRITRHLGVVNDYFHALKKETHTRHFFQAEATADLPDTWEGKESHDGEQNPTRFEFFWLPISERDQLIADQGALLDSLK